MQAGSGDAVEDLAKVVGEAKAKLIKESLNQETTK